MIRGKATRPIPARDLACGVVVALIGAWAILQGQRYHVGTLTQMQAGYFPIVLGGILLLLGVIMVVQAVTSREAPAEQEVFLPPDWRGCTAIVFGVLGFIVFGQYFGLAPAVFACVFISAIGDRSITLRGALVLSAILTVFAVGLFAYVLQIQFPVWQWPWAP
jgi:hypothetical protein